MIVIWPLRTKPSGLYGHGKGLGFVQSRFTEKGNYTSGRQACYPRKGESHVDTGEGLLPYIFTVHQSGPYEIAWTPEDPVILDCLSSVCASMHERNLVVQL